MLSRTLYGTWDAASAWNSCIQGVLVNELGFTRGLTSPCIFYHPGRNLRVLVHGDDFVSLGAPPDLYQFRQELETRWLMKIRGMLGVEVQSIDILNRVLTVTPSGILYEADPKHAKLI